MFPTRLLEASVLIPTSSPSPSVLQGVSPGRSSTPEALLGVEPRGSPGGEPVWRSPRLGGG
ncbi:hypothetical protein EYF80_059572 [Liparis tanakae]|uniref:Uncharacterized protein n=1 Tax=Liparis tanakae TaxID=230148 RepID=A0A4Z2ENF1_9TELE|nr:hypothetical protein EYF80_059572 [Liparis tanakae]